MNLAGVSVSSTSAVREGYFLCSDTKAHPTHHRSFQTTAGVNSNHRQVVAP